MEKLKPSFAASLNAFSRGLMKGVITGGLMAGVFTLVALTFGASTPGWAGAVVLSLSAGVFNGLMGVYHHYQYHKQAVNGQMHEGHVAAASPGMVPVLVPTVAQDRSQMPEQEAPARNWSASLDRKPGHDRIKEIITDRAIDDKTRAAALLAEREARTATPAEAVR